MYIEGRELADAAPLHTDISTLVVDLKCGGFGIDLRDDVDESRLWLGGVHSHARHDPSTDRLDIIEHRASFRDYPPGSVGPLMWLNLPRRYAHQPISEIDITAPGAVYIQGVWAERLTVCTAGRPVYTAERREICGVALQGVHIGERALCKTVHHDIIAEGIVAPLTDDAEHTPSVDLAALTGKVLISGGKASWRVYGAGGIIFADSHGPIYSPQFRHNAIA